MIFLSSRISNVILGQEVCYWQSNREKGKGISQAHELVSYNIFFVQGWIL